MRFWTAAGTPQWRQKGCRNRQFKFARGGRGVPLALVPAEVVTGRWTSSQKVVSLSLQQFRAVPPRACMRRFLLGSVVDKSQCSLSAFRFGSSAGLRIARWRQRPLLGQGRASSSKVRKQA